MLTKFGYGLGALLMVVFLTLTPSAQAGDPFFDREDLFLELILFDRFFDPFDKDRFDVDRFDRFDRDRFDRFDVDRFDRDRFERFDRFDRPGLGFGRIGPPGRPGGFNR